MFASLFAFQKEWMIIDNVQNNIWLRVQSWGRTFYINYIDFVEYNMNYVLNGANLYFFDV